jgi:uncharacterized iron-regulated protein
MLAPRVLKMPRLAALVVVTLLITACAGDRSTLPAEGAPGLAGRIYDVQQARFLDEDELMARLAWAEFVLLGETHANPEHHRLQAMVVQALEARSPQPRAVAFEMMGTDQQLAIVEHLQEHPGDAAGLGEALDWSSNGWPDWVLYEPIAQAGLDGGGQIVAANLPRGDVRAVFDVGLIVLRASVVERTGLDERLPDPLAASLKNELQASHCGGVSNDSVDGMFRVQRARDATMADRLAATSGTGGGILIAGAGHVRKDRGVPWYLRRLRPQASIASLAFLDAAEDLDPTRAELHFDFVWFTGAGGTAEPCADLEIPSHREDAAERSLTRHAPAG